ncbi:DUF1345 domain-containing protein [Pseudonocardia nematodicida]|uniref:DUF1345 domain-containing protein n=1 Tax=Pseudonocardia nematodicida TaxID=1206997 RepID=A0ABV1KCT7_9PSEU
MPAAPSDRPAPAPDRGRPPGSRRPFLASDGPRYLVTTAATVVLAAAYGAIVQTVSPAAIGSLGFVVTVYFGAWSVWAALYAGLTVTVLRRAGGIALVDWLTEDRSGRRRRRRTELLTGSGGPLGALSFCAVAIGAVVGAMVVRELREDPVVVGLAVPVVLTSWVLIVTVYAVHYARENARAGGLDFAGCDDGPPGFADHLYLAVQISTAYTSADVAVTGQGMRHTAALHAVVAFVFNTVLIALLVSLLVTVTT